MATVNENREVSYTIDLTESEAEGLSTLLNRGTAVSALSALGLYELAGLLGNIKRKSVYFTSNAVVENADAD